MSFLSQHFTNQAIASYYLQTEGFTPRSNRNDEAPIPNPRHLSSVEQLSVVTNNAVFDALYVLALNEMDENAVQEIRNDAFKNNEPIECAPSGCFQAGKRWTYVWTRDTSYAVHLALAALKPQTTLNSLLFKTSPDRAQKSSQIVQDTGTGGSYPVSSDRVVWALGAEKLLHYLPAEQQATFRSTAFEIVKNTIEQDRRILFDNADGLYRGEQSFLDWREQTYPGWVAQDVVHVGMSKCLSTNLLHFNILNFGAKLAQEAGDTDTCNRYQNWASHLQQAIRGQLYLEDAKLYSTFITTFLDKAPAHQFDLLGSVLAILLDVATEQEAQDIIANYPVLSSGPPVIWPQQKDTRIYHNRAIWPFVTAYWVKAAQKVGNTTAVNHGIYSLMQGVMRYRSNMENFEMVSGETYVDEGSTSGPVVDSQAQLWSIAGYLSMVNDVIFGLETSSQGIRFLPYLTSEIRNSLFGNTNCLTLNNFPYQGKRITVSIKLPDPNAQTQGVYKISQIQLNGEVVSQEFITDAALQSNNFIEIEVSEGPTLLSDNHKNSIHLITDTVGWQNLFAPKYPIIRSVEVVSGKVQLSLDGNGEQPEEIAFNIYRDGILKAEGLPGSTTVWVDGETSGDASPSYCYTAETYYCNSNLAIRNYSQKSPPFCYWGVDDQRIQTFHATKELKCSGSDSSEIQASQIHGYPHYENWGKPEHTLVLDTFKPKVTGPHLFQVCAANGSGGFDTGITCAVKYIKVINKATGTTVDGGYGYLIMPQTSTWEKEGLRDSSFVQVNLDAEQSYEIVIGEDEYSHNMSYLERSEDYTANGGIGGATGAFNSVNITVLKVMSLTA